MSQELRLWQRRRWLAYSWDTRLRGERTEVGRFWTRRGAEQFARTCQCYATMGGSQTMGFGIERVA